MRLAAILFKLNTICTLFFLTSGTLQAQWGYTFVDNLVSATHPNGCSDSFVTGPPDQKTWVNLNNGDITTAMFGSAWLDDGAGGDELVVHTAFHTDSYTMRLILQGGGFSAPHTVNTSDWSNPGGVNWNYSFRNGCSTGFLWLQEYILPLDFDTDFGINGSTGVIGVEITFVGSAGAPDFAGIYVTDEAITPPPLPIKLISFKGGNKDDYNLLQWKTASEINNDYFSVERSDDGVEFIEIRKVQGAGNSNSIMKYDYRDQDFSNNIQYYRLKQVDFNGTYTYSSTIALTNEIDPFTVSNIYPNPSENVFNYDIYSISEDLISIEIINHIGLVVKKKDFNLSKGNTTITFDLIELPKGIYATKLYNMNSLLHQTTIVKK